MATSGAEQTARLLLAAAVLAVLLHSAASTGACGAKPTVVYVGKGEKKHVRFWNTDVAATPPGQSEEGPELGSGEEPDSIATAPAVTESAAEATEPPAAAAVGEEPFVVTPAGPEAATEPPLYDTQPHIVLPEAPPLEEPIADSVVSLILDQDGRRPEPTTAVAAGAGDAAGGDAAASEGSGEQETPDSTTEREFLTTLDPFDLVAIADNQVEAELEKSIRPVAEGGDNAPGGSGNSQELPASATVPLTKYEEIRIPHDPADHDPAEADGSGDLAVVLDDSATDGANEDRLITLAGFSGDKVLLEWTPDDEASGAAAEDAAADGSGLEPPATAPLDPVPDDSGSELPLTLLELADPELPVEQDGGADTDELLPLVQEHSSIHQLLSSLPLSRPAEQDVPSAPQPAAVAAAATDGAAADDVPERATGEQHQVESAPGDLSPLDRLLLLQGFASDDRVILQHVPDPPEAGSGQAEDEAATLTAESDTPLAAADAQEGSGQQEASELLADPDTLEGSAQQEASELLSDPDTLDGSGQQEPNEPLAAQDEREGSGLPALLEASGDGQPDVKIPEIPPSKIKNSWVAKEAAIKAPSHEIPETASVHVDVEDVDMPVVRERERLAQVEGAGPDAEAQLPVAETEGHPITQDGSKVDAEKQKAAGSGSDNVENTKSAAPSSSSLDSVETEAPATKLAGSAAFSAPASAADSVPDSAADSAPASAADSVQDPVADPAPDSAADPAQDPVADSAQDPVAESAQDPVADSAQDPVATESGLQPSVSGLDRETLLGSIYRIIHDHNTPDGMPPLRRPAWVDFSPASATARFRPRGPYPTREPLSTEETIIVGGAPYVEVYSGAGGRERPQERQPAWDRPEQQYPAQDGPGSALWAERRQRRDTALLEAVHGPLRMEKPEQQITFDAVESIRNTDDQLFRFIRSQPYPFVSALLNGRARPRISRLSNAAVDCEWQIKTESHLYLLVTLNNLSAPYTVDCDGAYIEVERERDGFEARWCGNRIKQSGSRPHMVFARGEVRIAVFNDGNTTELPTGFEADVEVVDLLDARQYATFRRSGLNFRRLIQDPLLPLS